MAQWVRDELEGYTNDAVPPYRVIDVAYRGTFSGPFGTGLQNVPIPSALIDQVAGKNWTRRKMTESISEIGQLAGSAKSDGELTIECANLILLLRDKIYPDLVCNGVVGIVSPAQMASVLDVVRSRVLDLTIAMEKADPDIRAPVATPTKMNKVVHQTIYADNVTVVFERDLERIVADRITASDGTEREKARLAELVKGAGIQEVVKQIVQKAPEVLRLLGGMAS